MESTRQQKIHQVAEALVTRRHGVALTGAGISVDSGIPDFRSPGGLWERFDPMEYATIDAFRANPERVWGMLVELEQMLETAQPNPGHLGLARLEKSGVLDGIVTQNIDNLHHKAESSRVVEFHGNGSRLRCLGCDRVEPVRAEGRGGAPPRAGAERPMTPRAEGRGGAPPRAGAERPMTSGARELGMPPRCPSCSMILKPDAVFFGEPIPQAAMSAAMELLESCQVMLAVGTSATVAPASMLPLAAQQHGALLVEVNLEPTELTGACDIALHGRAAETLPQLADEVDRLLAG
jgi:NAD-dependent deacetylase